MLESYLYPSRWESDAHGYEDRVDRLWREIKELSLEQQLEFVKIHHQLYQYLETRPELVEKLPYLWTEPSEIRFSYFNKFIKARIYGATDISIAEAINRSIDNLSRLVELVDKEEVSDRAKTYLGILFNNFSGEYYNYYHSGFNSQFVPFFFQVHPYLPLVCRFGGFCALLFDSEIPFQRIEELLSGMVVQVFDHTVVIQDLELNVGKENS